jgi:hypothetical protein
MSIRKATPPNLIGAPQTPAFQVDRFEALIWNKGYTIIIENAIACPCRGKSGAPLTTCQSCNGLGWVFLDPVETKAIVTGINYQTKYRQWSPELTGVINLTLRESERVSYMDRVTFSTKTSVLSEVKPLIDAPDGKKFIFCSYDVKSIRSIYMFDGVGRKLVKLTSSQYSIKPENPTIVIINMSQLPTNFNGVATIEYEHLISYNVIDLSHDIRSTFVMNDKGQNVEVDLPVQAVARRSHLVFGKTTNYTGDNHIDN